MTESEWDSCTDPVAMLGWLVSSWRISDCKYRLFVASCWRSVWHRLTEPERWAVEAFEGNLAGEVPEEEWDWEIVQELQDALALRVWPQGWGVALRPLWDEEASEVAAVLSATGLLGSWEYGPGVQQETALYHARAAEAGGSAWPAWTQQRTRHCALLRDIFGSLPPLSPSLRAWQDALIPRLAQAAYDERFLPSGHLDPDRLAVLADALFDAGCTDADLIRHLRGPGPHWRGCHALDTILGRS